MSCEMVSHSFVAVFYIAFFIAFDKGADNDSGFMSRIPNRGGIKFLQREASDKYCREKQQ